MSVGHRSYRWIGGSGLPLYYRITLVRGPEPDEVLRRYGADPRTARSMTLEERSCHPDSRRLVSVHDLGGWTLAIEDDCHHDLGANAAAALSAGTELVSVYTNVLAHHHFTHIVDGDVRTDLTRWRPTRASAADPTAWWTPRAGSASTPTPAPSATTCTTTSPSTSSTRPRCCSLLPRR